METPTPTPSVTSSHFPLPTFSLLSLLDEAAHEAQAPIPLFENPVDAAAAKLVFDNFYRRFECE